MAGSGVWVGDMRVFLPALDMAACVAVHQATYRMMLGANPSKTNQLLKTVYNSNLPTPLRQKVA